MPDKLICLGVIVGAHGVHGHVRIKSFTEVPEGLFAYGPLRDERGQAKFHLSPRGRVKGGLIAVVDGVKDRNGALRLRGQKLYVCRSALPEPDDPETFYHADLVGLNAETGDGRQLGTVAAMHNFGGGEIMEIMAGDGQSIFIPFTRAAVPHIDLAGGRVVIEPPSELGVGNEQEGSRSPEPRGGAGQPRRNRP